MRLRKQDRLLKRSDFKALLTEAHAGRRAQNILKVGCFRVYRNLKETPARLGINVARRILKSSVDRNRVKRCLREFFRLNRERLSGDYLFKLERAPQSSSCTDLTGPLKRLLSD
jgi:ribonuclease P protein component